VRAKPAWSLALVLSVVACGDRSLSWYYRLGAGVDDVVLLEARVRAGGCEGSVVHEQSFAPGGAMTPPSLDAGDYGFEIIARGADCAMIGRRCIDVTLPASDGSIVVDVVVDRAPSPCAEGTMCEAGRCVPAIDAGTPQDGGPRDAGGDAGCDGCMDGGACVTGDSPTACGSGGGVCEACLCSDACVDGACVPSRPVSSVAAGREHTCALAGGVLYCWGSSDAGELAAWIDPRPTPMPSDGRTDWLELSTTASTICARRGAEVHCWGSNNYGQLGIGAGAATNVAVITEIEGAHSWSIVSVGVSHTLGVDTAGQLFCWGHGANESCAVRDGANRPEPVALGADAWDTVCAGLWQSCGLRDGALYCWGWSVDGEAGVMGSTLDTVTRVEPATTDWTAIACGVGRTCAIREGGRLFCFGCGDDTCYAGTEEACGGDCSGSLGSGLTLSSAVPVEITGIEARIVDANTHTCAIDMDGVLYCWGTNVDGQLGTGDTAPRSAPFTVPGGDWIDVSTGRRHTCAIREGGALYCWGRNEELQLGTSAMTADVLVPTRVCFP
jgi:hypothetical protein